MLDPIIYPLSIDTFSSTVEYLTDITEVGAQKEYRIARADDGLIYFDAMQGIRSLKDLQTLVTFHRCRKGRARAFLVRDLLDFESVHRTAFAGSIGLQAIGTGDGATDEFQLKKTYSDLYNSEVRNITKAEHSTIKIYVNSTLKTEGTHYNLKAGYQGKNSAGANYLCTVDGIVEFTGGNIPGVGAVIEAAYRFYVPLRFMEDRIPIGEIMSYMKPDPNNTSEWILDPTNADGELPKVMMREVKET